MTDMPSSSTSTHRSLLERARGHDPVVWERILALYGPLVLGWCRSSGLRDEDAADVFQNVFQAVASHINTFQRERPGGTFRGWLRTITRNKIVDLYRSQQLEPQGVGGSEARDRLTLISEPIENEESAPGELDETSFLHRALALIRQEFEPRTWDAFWQTAVEGRTTADVAADLGMTTGAVRVAKSRVLHRLRTDLGDRP